ncbi:hypothetical protein [Mucilaginibacter myungsuensis]|uniref:DUF1579 domain-containing protein n=1 Tax=Mucilaginibacter myungsuensis TaxID=649104 RepID=A0A929KYD3_9SPHI|nr:hypothetical protein [Mucilaginibacter myungsuensis]MBE9662800.1 hypothetical protein [Mucilaginibacter myungsuensis]MDN3598220.1 hypothetical protein [Mucilaginibacter myungsuensis]
MKKLITTLLTFCLITGIAIAQPKEADKAAKAEVSKLSFITGNWAGQGWMMTQAGKSTFEQTEKVRFKLDSTALLIEGLGKTSGKVIHNALAVVNLNKAGGYNFRSFLATGQEGAFKGELIGNKFYWYPNETIRYIIELNDKKQWYEVGEMKRGDQWTKFFEMTLDKVK